MCQTWGESNMEGETILGVIGSIIRLIAIPVYLFAVSLFLAFYGGEGAEFSSLIVNFLVIGGIIVFILGMVGSVFVKDNRLLSRIIMLIAGIGGLFVAFGFFIGAVLLIIGGIIAIVKSRKRK